MDFKRRAATDGKFANIFASLMRQMLINPFLSYHGKEEKEDYWKDTAVIRPSAREKSHWTHTHTHTHTQWKRKQRVCHVCENETEEQRNAGFMGTLDVI